MAISGWKTLPYWVCKTLPKACSHYSVTELEMTGLLVIMGLWKNILKH